MGTHNQCFGTKTKTISNFLSIPQFCYIQVGFEGGGGTFHGRVLVIMHMFFGNDQAVGLLEHVCLLEHVR